MPAETWHPFAKALQSLAPYLNLALHNGSDAPVGRWARWQKSATPSPRRCTTRSWSLAARPRPRWRRSSPSTTSCGSRKQPLGSSRWRSAPWPWTSRHAPARLIELLIDVMKHAESLLKQWSGGLISGGLPVALVLAVLVLVAHVARELADHVHLLPCHDQSVRRPCARGANPNTLKSAAAGVLV